MNKTILLLLLIFLTILNGTSQNWIRQESNTTSDLWKVHFLNSKPGFAVGSNGLILKTIDGGDHWNVKPSGTKNSLLSVCFIDTLTGFAISGSEILKTENAGESWFLQDTISNKFGQCKRS